MTTIRKPAVSRTSGTDPGTERRKKQRRSGLSRRDMVRWEPDKADRRQSKGRRVLDDAWVDKRRG